MSKAFVDTPLSSCIVFARGNVPGGVRAAAFLGSFVPTLLAICFLSTPRLRRQWAFWILAAALLIAMSKCILEMRMTSSDIYESDILQPETYELWNDLYYAVYFLQWTIPWICDSALLCKLLAFHSASTVPWKRRAAIIAFPLTMQALRVPLLIPSLVLLQKSFSSEATSSQTRLLVVEGAMQVAQNCFCSGFLLRKARQFAQQDYAAANRQAHRARLGLRYFTESILFTFLPASVLQIGWLVVAIISIWSLDASTQLQRADFYLRMFNVTFSIDFGLLAVWWATARIHTQEAGQASSQLRIGAAKEHASALDMSLLDWALGPISDEHDRATKEEVTAGAYSNLAEAQGEDGKEDASLRRRRQIDD